MEYLNTNFMEDGPAKPAMDFLKEGVQIIDRNWTLIYVNDSLANYHQLHKEDIIGTGMLEQYPGIENTLALDAMERCMYERTTQKLKLEFTFRNDKCRWLDLTIEPIEEGILILSLDITSRMQAELKNRRLTNLNAFLTQVNKQIVRTHNEASLFDSACDLAIQFGQFRMAWIGLFDETSKTISMVSQKRVPEDVQSLFIHRKYENSGPQDFVLKTGKHYFSNDIENEPSLQVWRPFIARFEIKSAMVLPIYQGGKIIGTLNLYSGEKNFAQEEEKEILISVVDDISFAIDRLNEHKQKQAAQEKLHSSEILYRHTLDHMLEGAQIHGFDWKYLYANDAVVKTSHYSLNELIGATPMQLYPGIEGTEFFKAMKRCMEERTTENLDIEFVFPDGSKGEFEVSVQPIPEGIFVLSIDRTEQNRAKEKLVKSTRMYAFISAINQSIVHTTDMRDLLQKVCEVAVNIGKFKLATIGLRNPENGKISFLCQHGVKSKNVSQRMNTEVDYSLAPLNNSPIGKVLASGKKVVCNDTLSEPGLDAWHDEMKEHHLLSGVTFPIQVFGETAGVMSFYASQEDFFDDAELVLLDEAVMDVSFALENFERSEQLRLTEEIAANEERRFKALIDKSVDLKTLTSSEGDILYCSPSVSKVLGYSMDAFQNFHEMELLHPDSKAEFVKNLAGIQNTPGGSVGFQYRILHSNGTFIWCEGTHTNMLHVPGVNAIVNNLVDISERKRAEEQRAFDRNNLAALINNTTDLMWSVDTNYKLIISNSQLQDMIIKLGGDSIEPGSNMLDFAFSEEQAQSFKKAYDRAFQGDSFILTEYISDPFEMWSEISFAPIRNGKEVIGAACHSRDITNRMRTESQLRRSEAGLKDAQALARMGNWEVDLLSGKNTWSEGLFAVFGIEEVSDTNLEFLLNMVHSEDLERVNHTFESAFKNFTDTHCNFRFFRQDGEERFGYSQFYFDRNADGIPVRAYGIFQDVTELKRQELLLQKSEKFNRSVLRSLKSHIAVINHEGLIIAANEAWNNFSINNGELNLERTGEGSNYFQVCQKSVKNGSEYAQRALDGMLAVLENRMSKFYMEYPCHSNDRQRWFVMRAVKFEGDEPMVVISHENITNLKLAERERDTTLAELELRVERRTKELSDKNDSILDSINYAKRIQEGLLAQESTVSEVFSNSFVLSKPRDIVSGDFYWCFQRRNKKFIILADCTGHGVPGALMSIIGTYIINQLIVNENLENPSEILELMDERLKLALKGDQEELKDGMDMAVCLIDYTYNELHFSGALLPLYMKIGNTITEIPPERIAIGGGCEEACKRFDTTRLAFTKGTKIYLSSDGYHSQFGGPNGKKYMKKRFKSTLQRIHHLPLNEQKSVLCSELNEWKGDLDQVDDILVIGIQL